MICETSSLNVCAWTAFLLALALQILDRGRGVLFCTTKHDPALPRALAWAAARRGRLGEFWLYTPRASGGRARASSPSASTLSAAAPPKAQA